MPNRRMLEWGAGLTVLASTTATASATSATFTDRGIATAEMLIWELNVTAASGTTPTLDAGIVTSFDGGTNWILLGRFTQVTTTVAKSYTKTWFDVAAPAAGSTATLVSVATASIAFSGMNTDTMLSRNFGFSNLFKVRYEIAGTTPSYTFAVNVYPFNQLTHEGYIN